jgi:hypothetical protein
MKRWLRSGAGVLLMVASAVGVYNVVSDNAEVERLAEATACGGGEGKTPQAGCVAKKTMMERNAIAQTFEFSTGKRQVSVRCARAAIFLGAYACEVR